MLRILARNSPAVGLQVVNCAPGRALQSVSFQLIRFLLTFSRWRTHPTIVIISSGDLSRGVKQFTLRKKSSKGSERPPQNARGVVFQVCSLSTLLIWFTAAITKICA